MLNENIQHRYKLYFVQSIIIKQKDTLPPVIHSHSHFLKYQQKEFPFLSFYINLILLSSSALQKDFCWITCKKNPIFNFSKIQQKDY